MPWLSISLQEYLGCITLLSSKKVVEDWSSKGNQTWSGRKMSRKCFANGFWKWMKHDSNKPLKYRAIKYVHQNHVKFCKEVRTLKWKVLSNGSFFTWYSLAFRTAKKIIGFWCNQMFQGERQLQKNAAPVENWRSPAWKGSN